MDGLIIPNSGNTVVGIHIYTANSSVIHCSTAGIPLIAVSSPQQTTHSWVLYFNYEFRISCKVLLSLHSLYYTDSFAFSGLRRRDVSMFQWWMQSFLCWCRNYGIWLHIPKKSLGFDWWLVHVANMHPIYYLMWIEMFKWSLLYSDSNRNWKAPVLMKLWDIIWLGWHE